MDGIKKLQATAYFRCSYMIVVLQYPSHIPQNKFIWDKTVADAGFLVGGGH